MKIILERNYRRTIVIIIIAITIETSPWRRVPEKFQVTKDIPVGLSRRLVVGAVHRTGQASFFILFFSFVFGSDDPVLRTFPSHCACASSLPGARRNGKSSFAGETAWRPHSPLLSIFELFHFSHSHILRTGMNHYNFPRIPC